MLNKTNKQLVGVVLFIFSTIFLVNTFGKDVDWEHALSLRIGLLCVISALLMIRNTRKMSPEKQSWNKKRLLDYVIGLFVAGFVVILLLNIRSTKIGDRLGEIVPRAVQQNSCTPLKILKAGKDWTSAPYYPPGCILAGDTPVNKECYWAKNAINDSVMVAPEEHPGIIANANSYRSCTNEVAEIYLLYQPRP
jgi:hypothetical protein